MKYEFAIIEKKWQTYWETNKTFKVTEDTSFSKEKRIYCLEMFPYPSGSGLHVGHLKNYFPLDAFCRFKWMNGFNVLHPMGWDAFGQPAENEAIKRGRNPNELVPEYATIYRNTLKKVGCSYDWDREINSSTPDYYKWTQWIFLLLHKKGLAYRGTAPINWCPSCTTGLANEEVKENRCWRCDTLVEKRSMPQWFFKITAYADELLHSLKDLNWSAGLKETQKEWIGRSEGAEVDFSIDKFSDKIRIFTTRPDTLFGATFLVMAPEHPLVQKIMSSEVKSQVESYINKAKNQTEIERMNVERTKTGVFIGAYAVNPVNNTKIPIWISDYVLMGYGTGAIMAVPAHDSRDFEFAKKFSLPIIQVVSTTGAVYELQAAEEKDGVAVNSGQFSGLSTEKFKAAILHWLEEQGVGKASVTYKIRDWLISRQRYWGAPIPIIHCPICGQVPVPEKDLPVILPMVDKYTPSGTGESPLATIDSFVNTSCPKCGHAAKRETDTMGGFACSSWYFLRFVDPNNSAIFASKEALNYWLPVDLYAGGIEHARAHLLYARFWTKVLRDAGFLNFSEPFQTLRNQGSLLANTPGRKPKSEENSISGEGDALVNWIVLKPEERDLYPADQIVWRWARMSKSKGNVVTPDEMAAKYGADSLRVYLLFVVPFEDSVMWNEDGVVGASRFLNRVWRWLDAALPLYQENWSQNNTLDLPAPDRAIRCKLHQTIRKVTGDIEAFQFNTAVAALMELTNEMYIWNPVQDEKFTTNCNINIVSEITECLIKIIEPFAPHMAEEMWERLHKPSLVVKSQWPQYSEEVATKASVTIVFQVNGKLRASIEVAKDTSEQEMTRLALENEKIKVYTEGKTVVKTIAVINKLVNIVVK